VKHERTADCVIGGFRLYADRPLPSSLLLGLYDEPGALRHIGVTSSFPERARIEGHPWERGFLMARGPATGRLHGAAASWNPGRARARLDARRARSRV
jgi:ATP-dependent DNA ligase